MIPDIDSNRLWVFVVSNASADGTPLSVEVQPWPHVYAAVRASGISIARLFLGWFCHAGPQSFGTPKHPYETPATLNNHRPRHCKATNRDHQAYPAFIAQVKDHNTTVARVTGAVAKSFPVAIPQPTLWSPTNPHLYGATVTLSSSNDTVEVYFGMRKVSMGTDNDGKKRVLLNNEFLFQSGVLDQVWVTVSEILVPCFEHPGTPARVFLSSLHKNQ